MAFVANDHLERTRVLILDPFNLETKSCSCPIPTTNKVGISLGIAVRSSSSIPQPCGRKRVLDSIRRRPSRKRPSLSRINVGTIDSINMPRSKSTNDRPCCRAHSCIPSLTLRAAKFRRWRRISNVNLFASFRSGGQLSGGHLFNVALMHA